MWESGSLKALLQHKAKVVSTFKVKRGKVQFEPHLELEQMIVPEEVTLTLSDPNPNPGCVTECGVCAARAYCGAHLSHGFQLQSDRVPDGGRPSRSRSPNPICYTTTPPDRIGRYLLNLTLTITLSHIHLYRRI